MKKATKRQVIRRPEKEKLELIEQWEQSGLSIKRFCDGHGFSDSLFHGWLNKYRRHKEKSRSEFVPVQIQPSLTPSQDHAAFFAEVTLPSGHHIRLYYSVTADYLRTLIA